MSSKGKIVPGNILIAQPFMDDGNFKRSVVLVTDNDPKDGTVGFILNKPIDMKINELMGTFPEIDAPVFYGGPVSTDTIHYIHDVGHLLNDSIPISEGLYWGGDFNHLKALVSSDLIGPQNIKFFVGYSGWSKGQLAAELSQGTWIVSDMDFNYAFFKNPKALWKKVLDNKGDVYSVISQMPDNPSYN